jgi:hypothetical protein
VLESASSTTQVYAACRSSLRTWLSSPWRNATVGPKPPGKGSTALARLAAPAALILAAVRAVARGSPGTICVHILFRYCSYTSVLGFQLSGIELEQARSALCPNARRCIAGGNESKPEPCFLGQSWIRSNGDDDV